MVSIWPHILFARLNGVRTWCEGMHAMCMGTITNMHISMESMYSAWTLLQVDKEYMHVSKNLGHGSMEHMYDLGLKQCLCNCCNFYVVYKHWLVSMCMHDRYTVMYVAQVDKHGPMAHMDGVHMHIYGAMAQRQGVHGCYGTLHGSREQIKAHGAYVFTWWSIDFNA